MSLTNGFGFQSIINVAMVYFDGGALLRDNRL